MTSKSDFLELLTPNYYKIHSFVFSLVANKADAEDVLQAAVAYLWEHFDDFERGTNFLAWAFTIAKFQVLTYRKKQQRSRVYFCDKTIQLIESENLRLADEMDVRYEYLSKCMRKLPEQDMHIIKNRFEKSIPIRDIADEFGATANVMYKRLAKIKKALLKCVHRSLANGGSL